MKIRNQLLVFFWAVGLTLSVANAYEAKSGYEFIKSETQAMQDDEMENPGYLAVERGRELFHQNTDSDKSCVTCHGSEGEKLDVKKIAQYPLYDAKQKQTINLQDQLQRCQKRTDKEMLPVNHPDMVTLETFVKNKAFGEPVNVQTDGEMTEVLKKGEDLYKIRYGLIDMSCYHCHGMYPGQYIRGQKISQGQGNGFPAYRLDIGEMTNLGQRIQQCLTLMRAEPFEVGSSEIKALEAYIMSRSNGLLIETPAVRY